MHEPECPCNNADERGCFLIGIMNRPKVTLKKRLDSKETFDILWEENGVEKNVGTGQYLDSALWFYLLEDNLDIWVDDGDNLNLIRGWD